MGARSFFWQASAAALLAAACFTASGGVAGAQQAQLPRPAPVFQGVAAPELAQSRPDFIEPIRAPQGAPNVFLIMTDDAGFAAASTFGGPIPTPNLERLAQQGLTFTQFHTTAICSPSRASLLTGRNAHAVGQGMLADLPTGYPGYNSVIPDSAATIGRVLRDNGYSTAWFGKHHNYAPWLNPAGPFDQWPTGLGFDYFYGFIAGESDQWNPRLYRGTSLVDVTMPAGETLDHVLADDAIHWIHNQQAAAPNRPFFIYYATGTPHAPHQAPSSWIDRFRGQFDQGWDRLREQSFARQRARGIVPRGTDLTPRPAEIPAWNTLSADAQRANARMMEVYAGMLAYEDAQIGRIIEELRRMGELENTLVIFIEGDNGASAEGGPEGLLNEHAEGNGVHIQTQDFVDAMPLMGGPRTFEIFPAGWGWALNAPFQWTKQIASHLGGTRNGVVMSWPRGIERVGGVRRQFSHLNDIMPTILEATGVSAPSEVDGVAQQPFDGVSLVYAFEHPDAPERHTTQYFEVAGNRAIYHDGWMANTRPNRMAWQNRDMDAPPGELPWELYNLRRDYAQAHDLAAAEPDRLADMRRLWAEEAERNNVFPIDRRSFGARGREGAMHYNDWRSHFEYWGGDVSVMTAVAPSFAVGPFEVSASVALPSGRANGVLLAVGSQLGGWSFYLQDGRPVAYHAVSAAPDIHYRIAAQDRIPAGEATIRFAFTPDARALRSGGVLRISVNGVEVGQGRIDQTIVMPVGLSETLDTGRDTGGAVSDDYAGEGRFEGRIDKIDVTLGGR